MKQTMTQEQKNKIFVYSASGFIFILLLTLTIFGVITTTRQARDIIRLSDLSGLQTDLLEYYKNKNIFPTKILTPDEVKKQNDCDNNLCLSAYPLDPKTGARYKYTPCQDLESEYCEDGHEYAKGFIIDYVLEIGAGAIKKGAYQVKPSGLVN